jgi:hypothetical protein
LGIFYSVLVGRRRGEGGRGRGGGMLDGDDNDGTREVAECRGRVEVCLCCPGPRSHDEGDAGGWDAGRRRV